MTQRLSDNALKLAALASQLERSLHIKRLWPDAFLHGGVKVMTLNVYDKRVNGEVKTKVKEAWLEDTRGERFNISLEDYERLKL